MAISATKAVKQILQEQNLEIAALGKRIGVSSAATWDRLKHENISIKKLNEMLKVLDYQIVLIPTDKRLPEGSIIVDYPSDKKQINLDEILDNTEGE